MKYEIEQKLLVRPEVYSDESLESYLLRLLRANGFSSYKVFGDAIWQFLILRDRDAAGAFPRSLLAANVYHANKTSSFRVRAFELINHLTDQELPTLKLAILHANAKFGSHKAVFRNGVDLPRSFLREDGIPVCPECLKERESIRQYWHFKPYTVCHIHNQPLLHSCPSCHQSLDYRKSERISECACGFQLPGYSLLDNPLSDHQFSDDEEDQQELDALAISQVIGEGNFSCVSDHSSFKGLGLSQVMGIIFWFGRFKDYLGENGIPNIDGMTEFFSGWPNSLYKKLDSLLSFKLETLTQSLNKVAFKEIFDSLLWDAFRLPERELRLNPVLAALNQYFEQLMVSNLKSKVANIGDVLLTLNETAMLLSTTYEQVYLLYKEGYLPIGSRVSLNTKLTQEVPAFHLRTVLELRRANMQSSRDSYSQYLPAW